MSRKNSTQSRKGAEKAEAPMLSDEQERVVLEGQGNVGQGNHSVVPGRYELNRSVLEHIWLERLRQKLLLREGKIEFDCASPIVCHDRKLRVLGEEFGEVARAIDLLEAARSIDRKKEGAFVLGRVDGRAKAMAHLREELTQLATVAIAWLESLEDTK